MPKQPPTSAPKDVASGASASASSPDEQHAHAGLGNAEIQRRIREDAHLSGVMEQEHGGAVRRRAWEKALEYAARGLTEEDEGQYDFFDLQSDMTYRRPGADAAAALGFYGSEEAAVRTSGRVGITPKSVDNGLWNALTFEVKAFGFHEVWNPDSAEPRYDLTDQWETTSTIRVAMGTPVSTGPQWEHVYSR